ncbi:efflux transporter outer membrane subunit [Allopusillimonas soli]|uniref:Efflux transporter outer membrane subunit n=2 Tax=Allopusillimonas soli TaxID=659016 RepID=A0A853FCS2_9BURK|nr:efflux transporter outer membrane subunit [Allopusillimonas soli]NYT36660.1 efflux transporter outer membrane subunit [Allopusillimonas soli]TEA75615.1 efflux transporter outer membrane subunit [Allopusillimonas soli]
MAARRALAPALLALALAGCSFAPDYHRPAAPVPGQYPDSDAVSNTGPRSAHAVAPQIAYSANLGWSEFFTDPRLQAMIRLALANNRDMRIAVQRVEEARAQYGIARSDLFPTIGAAASEQATRYPENLRMGGADSQSVSRTYTAGIGMTSFEIDFFGRLRNLSQAAFEQYLSTAQARRTVHINLVAQVAEAYFRLRTAEQLLTLSDSTLRAREATMQLVQARYDGGVASALDLNQARGQLETVRSDQQALRRSKAQAQNALRLLLGTQPPANLPEPAPFSHDQVLAAIPVGLPSDLLERRPDIMGAENVLRAANANIGAARAAFFPNISITGLLGFASVELGGLFSGSQRYWQFSPQLQTPIFAGGGLQSNLDLAKVRKNIAVAEYEKTIQTAFREVADALAGEATYAEQLDALRALEKSSMESLRLAELRYETGIDSFLQVQNAQVTLYATQQQFLQTGMDSLLNRVELYKALGGGWLEASAHPQVEPVDAIRGEAQGSNPTPP